MSRLGIEIIVVIALFVAGAVWLDRHDAAKEEIGRQQIIDADKAGVNRQKEVDAAKIADAGRIKVNELKLLKMVILLPLLSLVLVSCAAAPSHPVPTPKPEYTEVKVDPPLTGLKTMECIQTSVTPLKCLPIDWINSMPKPDN